MKDGTTRQQISDVICVLVKIIYNYFPVQYSDKPTLGRHDKVKAMNKLLLCASLRDYQHEAV